MNTHEVKGQNDVYVSMTGIQAKRLIERNSLNMGIGRTSSRLGITELGWLSPRSVWNARFEAKIRSLTCDKSIYDVRREKILGILLTFRVCFRAYALTTLFLGE